jgi:hypothetical protein
MGIIAHEEPDAFWLITMLVLNFKAQVKEDDA